MFHRRRLAAFAAGALALAAPGCAFGPKALEQTHGKYYEAVRRVEEEQLLRNIVHLRYVESPATLDVASIAAQYELAASAEAKPFFEAPNPSGDVFRTFAAILPTLAVSGSNRPTVTLDPADGGEAVRQFLTPITLDTLLFLTQSGWPVESVLRLWIDRVNGVPNGVSAAGPPRDRPPDFERFRRIAELMQAAQDREVATVQVEDREVEVGGPLPAEAVTAAATVEAAKGGFEYRQREDGRWSLVRRERRLVLTVTPGSENCELLAELFGLMNLKPGLPRYDILATPKVADPALHPSEPSAVVRVSPRATAQVWFFLAQGVEVPDEHYARGLVQPPPGVAPTEVTRGLFHVCVCKGHKPPPGAHVAVKYRDYWYYIDDRDLESKATFVLMLQLNRLDFRRQRLGGNGGPTLTLPVGR